MLHVACPSCGERGGISAELVGTRIKCRKCGQAFRVAGPAPKVAAAAPQTAGVGAPIGPAAAASPLAAEGIVVEGLDDAWTAAPAPPDGAPPAPTVAAEPMPTTNPIAELHVGPHKEYKLLSSRDKLFEGKFDLNRMEEVINQLARQGWTAKSMCLPHVKNFQGVMQEEIVVLLER